MQLCPCRHHRPSSVMVWEAAECPLPRRDVFYVRKNLFCGEKKKKSRKVRVKMWSCPQKQKFIAVALTVILLNTIFAVFCLDPIVGNVRNDKSREIFLGIFLVLQRP